MAYKKDVDDPRESPGFELMDLLLQKGAIVEYNDPHIPSLPPMRHYPQLQMSSQELTPAYLKSRDCVLIATDHSAYDWAWIAEHAPLIVDTRNALKSVAGSGENRAGLKPAERPFGETADGLAGMTNLGRPVSSASGSSRPRAPFGWANIGAVPRIHSRALALEAAQAGSSNCR